MCNNKCSQDMFHRATCINMSGQKIINVMIQSALWDPDHDQSLSIKQTEKACYYTSTAGPDDHTVLFWVFSRASKGQYYTDVCSVLIAQSLIHNSDMFPFCRRVCGFLNKTSFSSTQCAKLIFTVYFEAPLPKNKNAFSLLLHTLFVIQHKAAQIHKSRVLWHKRCFTLKYTSVKKI